MTKFCSGCKENKELEQFHNSKRGKYGVHHYCKICHSIYRKNSYDYTKSRAKGVFRRYNLNIHQLEELYISQNKKCKICNDEYSTVSKYGGLVIDHCHKTGKVRGLLCTKCNALLGMCNDDVEILKLAILYLTD